MKKRITFFLIRGWIPIILIASIIGASERPGVEPAHLPTIQEKNVPPNMDYQLYRYLTLYMEKGHHFAYEYARSHGFEHDVKGDMVRVVVETMPGGSSKNTLDAREIEGFTQQIASALERSGAKVELVHDVRIQLLAPVERIKRITETPGLRFIRFPIRPIPHVVSEGVQVTGATAWQNVSGFRGHSDVRVAVLDLGFWKYNNLRGVELPDELITRSFVKGGSITSFEVHGTACAEIIYDMNPGLQKLWLVNFGTMVEHSQAVDYLIGQKVDIISYSIGWFNVGAGDGTGPINEDVKRAVNSGITWVTSAGNWALKHWEGLFSDPDGDRWHNFAPNSELLEFYSPNGYPCVYLNWNDWGTWDGYTYSGSNNDFDLYLFVWNGAYYGLIDWSSNWQTGSQWPVEAVCGLWPGWYGVGIYRYQARTNIKLELFTTKNAKNLEHVVREGSISIPADSPYTIAVGATDWADDSLHTYSSRGPTSDGRIKPDFTAPSGVSNWVYGTFSGTSASAPHVAGGLSLLLMKTPFTLEQIRKILENRAIDLGVPGFDNSYGRGRLQLTPP